MTSKGRLAAGPLVGYVLHSYDWSESSLILELFTRERGRLVAVARGAKRPYSQLRPALLPFQRLALQFGRPRDEETGEVLTLRAAEWGGHAPRLAGDALFRGFYVNELLMRLLARQDPHPALHDAYERTLDRLAARGPERADPVLRAFELLLLRETGVLPQLDRVTATQQPVAPDAGYVIDAERGVGAAAAGTPALDGATLCRLQVALDGGADVDALVEAGRAAATALQAQLRPMLHYHLGTDRLRTRDVMREVRRLAETGRAGGRTTHGQTPRPGAA